MSIIETIDRNLDKVDRVIMVILFSLATILAFVNVVMRYVFGFSIVWAGELTTYLFIWATMFGASYGFKIGMHMSFNALVKSFPPKIGKAFAIFSLSITLFYLIMLTIWGVNLVKFDYMTGQVSIDMQIPFWIIYLVIPITMATAAWRTFVKLLSVIKMPAEFVHEHGDAKMENREEEGLIE